jgi:hypothetical protein
MRWNFRPSKPAAVFGAIVGAGMIAFALSSFENGGAFLIFWCAIVIGISGLNLWAAFSKNGSLYSATSDDDRPPQRFGERTEPHR